MLATFPSDQKGFIYRCIMHALIIDLHVSYYFKLTDSFQRNSNNIFSIGIYLLGSSL